MEGNVKKARVRSPAYPAIGLKEAIERVKSLYERDKTALVPMDSAAVHIGFTKAHGQALMYLSALRKFGLLDYQDRRCRVSRAAVEILTFPELHERRTAAIQQAALAPAIYRELFDKYQDTGLPSDDTLTAILIADHDFNPTAVASFLADFRASLEFAGLLSDGMLSLSHGGPEADHADGGEIAEQSISSQIRQPIPPTSGAKLMEGERVVFTHEIEPSHGVRIVASGEVDESLLDALEVYIQLQKRRLERRSQQPKASSESNQ